MSGWFWCYRELPDFFNPPLFSSLLRKATKLWNEEIMILWFLPEWKWTPQVAGPVFEIWFSSKGFFNASNKKRSVSKPCPMVADIVGVGADLREATTSLADKCLQCTPPVALWSDGVCCIRTAGRLQLKALKVWMEALYIYVVDVVNPVIMASFKLVQNHSPIDLLLCIVGFIPEIFFDRCQGKMSTFPLTFDKCQTFANKCHQISKCPRFVNWQKHRQLPFAQP